MLDGWVFMFMFGFPWTLMWIWLAQPPEGNVVHQTVGFSMFFSSCPNVLIVVLF